VQLLEGASETSIAVDHRAALVAGSISDPRFAVAVCERDANLKGAFLYSAKLKDANLKGANLVDARLDDADLWGASLEGADLTGACFKNTILVGANLKGATGANLEGAIPTDDFLRGAVPEEGDAPPRSPDAPEAE